MAKEKCSSSGLTKDSRLSAATKTREINKKMDNRKRRVKLTKFDRLILRKHKGQRTAGKIEVTNFQIKGGGKRFTRVFNISPRLSRNRGTMENGKWTERTGCRKRVRRKSTTTKGFQMELQITGETRKAGKKMTRKGNR